MIQELGPGLCSECRTQPRCSPLQFAETGSFASAIEAYPAASQEFACGSGGCHVAAQCASYFSNNAHLEYSSNELTIRSAVWPSQRGGMRRLLDEVLFNAA